MSSRKKWKVESEKRKEKVGAGITRQEKGGLTMSKKLLFSLGILAVGMLLITGVGNAAVEDSDSCLISVTPPSDYGITITTASADGIDLGTVGTLGEILYNTTITTVTNSGEVVSDWKIRVDDAVTWVVDDSNTDANAVGVNTVTICAVFGSTTSAVPEDDTYFDADSDSVDLLRTTVQNMTTTAYNNGDAEVDGDNVGAGDAFRLHIRMMTPSDTTVTTKQQFRVTIEAHESTSF